MAVNPNVNLGAVLNAGTCSPRPNSLPALQTGSREDIWKFRRDGYYSRRSDDTVNTCDAHQAVVILFHFFKIESRIGGRR